MAQRCEEALVVIGNAICMATHQKNEAVFGVFDHVSAVKEECRHRLLCEIRQELLGTLGEYLTTSDNNRVQWGYHGIPKKFFSGIGYEYQPSNMGSLKLLKTFHFARKYHCPSLYSGELVDATPFPFLVPEKLEPPVTRKVSHVFQNV